MALTISNVASQTNTASNANTTTAGTFSVSAGDMCIAFVALDNTGFGGEASLSSVTDNASNTYSQIALINQDPGAADAGATLGIYGVTYSSAASGLTVSANFSPNTVADVIAVYRLTPGSGEAVSLIAADTTGSKNSTTTHSAATVSVQNGDTIFGAAAIESNTAVTEDSDTTNGSWSAAFTGVANTGTDLTSMRLVVQHKTVTATGNQSWAATTSAAKDSACTYAVFRGVATGINIAADAGSYSLSGTAAGTLKGFIVPADAGSYTLSGTNADITVTVSAVLTAETGAYELSGTAAGTLKGFMVSAEAGSYALSGSEAVFYTEADIFAESGSYTLSGTTTGTYHSHHITAEAGFYTWSGTDAGLLVDWIVAAGPGIYAVTGTGAGMDIRTATVTPGGGDDSSTWWRSQKKRKKPRKSITPVPPENSTAAIPKGQPVLPENPVAKLLAQSMDAAIIAAMQADIARQAGIDAEDEELLLLSL